MRFVPQKSEKSVSGGGCGSGRLASVIDAAEPSVAAIGCVAGAGVSAIIDRVPMANEADQGNSQARNVHRRIREQLDGICTLRSAAINAALNIKGSFGEGFEAYMEHILKTKPELGLGFLKPLMNMGMESAAVGTERAPILIIQSGGPVSVQSVERAA